MSNKEDDMLEDDMLAVIRNKQGELINDIIDADNITNVNGNTATSLGIGTSNKWYSKWEQKILYGVPGAGKSYTVGEKLKSFGISEDDQDQVQRVTFYPDYTYTDFVGQIIPRLVSGDTSGQKKLTYEFSAGPFTQIMKKAWMNPDKPYVLIIEEINRGNAPAIFGDVFQLLDRYETSDSAGHEGGMSIYAITNYDIAGQIYENISGCDETTGVRIPPNLSIYATMNTADQNVFTLDTAFQRRWEMELIPDVISGSKYEKMCIGGTTIAWGKFASATNDVITKNLSGFGDSGDKRLGAYFAKISEITDRKKFAEKVLKYLWDDVFKMDREVYFNSDIKSIDDLISTFEDTSDNPWENVVKKEIVDEMV